MKVAETFEEVRRAKSGRSAVLVPTMGSLHDGHTSLVAIALGRSEVVVMSLFVNPLQFDDPGDLERYPRDPERDAVIAAAAGVDVLFSPAVEEMYPAEPTTRVTVGEVAEQMEGTHRPGHFAGVATVVAKLLAGVQPDVAVFGRKDAQQLAVVRRMVRDLSFPVEIVGAPIVREPDGLAMSSRNVFLGPDDRRAARSISEGLFAAADAVEVGERRARQLEALIGEHLERAGVEPEYVTLADAETASRIDTLDRDAFLAVAARVGPVRLIDNVFLWPDGSADRGTRTSTPGR